MIKILPMLVTRMKVIGYVRVSGKSQIDGDGPERQESAITEFCKIHDLELVGVWFELAVSGTVEVMERPVFSALLERVIAKQLDVEAIVVERLDRLARDLMVSEFSLAECRKANIKVFSADQGVLVDVASDGGDPTRKLIRHIMAALAEWEKNMLVKKLAVARARVREKKGRCEGPKPYGSTPEEQKVLDLISKLGVDLSWHEIAYRLNDCGYLTRTKQWWTAESVRKVWSRMSKHP